MTPPNPFANPKNVASYEAWYQTTGRTADQQEKALLDHLLSEYPTARSILEVGCGTGHFTRWFNQMNLRVFGLELSQPMLEESKRWGGLTCLQGDALDLPFEGSSFDLVAMITSLEFILDPIRALAEAVRVARQGLILGVINAHSYLGWKYKRVGGPIWDVAHLFTVGELTQIILRVTEKTPKFVWRTTLWPIWPGSLPLPWGGFIGMAVRLQ
jgi:ubiquinone/menaquinone biosynthesis C-methylase UbiE